MIAVALPDIQRNFDVGLSSSAWLVTIYLVAMAVGQPIGGNLGDRFGRRRVYLAGLIWFVVASIGCALAPNLLVLIVFRTQQALAGAFGFPNGAAMIRESTPGNRQGAGFGLIGLSTGTAAALGPPLGGVLVDAFGWASVFWVNVPLGMAAIGLGILALPHRASVARPRTRFDLPGSGLLTLALIAVILLPKALAQGWVATVAAVAVAVTAGVALVRRESGLAAPVVDVGLFRNRTFATACAGHALGNLVMYTTLLALPLYLEEELGYSLRTVGTILVALSACSALLGPIGGRWADRSGAWWPAVTGGAAVVIGAVVIAWGIPREALALIVPGLALIGMGLGIAGAPLIVAATSSVPSGQVGAAAGVFSTARYIGSIAGASVLAAMFTSDLSGAEKSRYTMLFAGLVVAALLTFLAYARVEMRPARTSVDATA
jgi:EmrB/QacA subfamily drug resistance transporter